MQDPEAAAELKKKRTFRKFSYRGIDLDQYVAKFSPPPPPIDEGWEKKTTKWVLVATPIATNPDHGHGGPLDIRRTMDN